MGGGGICGGVSGLRAFPSAYMGAWDRRVGWGRYIEVEVDLKGGEQDSGQCAKAISAPHHVLGRLVAHADCIGQRTDPKGGTTMKPRPRISDREPSEASGVSCIKTEFSVQGGRIVKWVLLS